MGNNTATFQIGSASPTRIDTPFGKIVVITGGTSFPGQGNAEDIKFTPSVSTPGADDSMMFATNE